MADNELQQPAGSYVHPTDVHCVRACLNEDALDLLAVGGENTVEILKRNLEADTPVFELVASFHVATRVRAIAWSPRTVSPSASRKWFLELVVAGADNKLFLLLHSPKQPNGDITDAESEVRPFGGGLSGHHKRINDICFCTSETYQTHVASIGDDGLILWNLYPRINEAGDLSFGQHSSDGGDDTEEEDVFQTITSKAPKPYHKSENTLPPQPTAYIIKFPHPLHSIASHPLSANQFMVSDSAGTVFIVDWTKLDSDKPSTMWKGHRVVELVDPRALTDRLTGGKPSWTGGASWKYDDINV
ncbi:hypothetical protein FRB99_001907 [Tulasnella sp. 403]|nr:hypothetical protein FRB99_001907 [Tulasnella sp. 403]